MVDHAMNLADMLTCQQFDEYQAHRQPNASESSNEAPGPSSSGISQGVTGSYGFAFIENATANRRQREKRTIKDLRAELKKYLEEDLVVVPKGQPFDLLSYWKVCFRIDLSPIRH